MVHQPTHVCRLKKDIWGLKQAPRAWFNTSHLSLNFSVTKVDPSLFIYYLSRGILLLLFYVNDIIVVGDKFILFHELFQHLSAHFVMKDLGILHYFLSTGEIFRPYVLFLSQTKYISELLCKFNLHTVKPITTPVASKTLLYAPMPLLIARCQYITMTKPNIFFAVNLVNEYMHQPRVPHMQVVKQLSQSCVPHMQVVKRLIRYLAGTVNGVTPR